MAHFKVLIRTGSVIGCQLWAPKDAIDDEQIKKLAGYVQGLAFVTDL
jgi:hypothetical protein